MSKSKRVPGARKRILGVDGKEMMQQWEPEGFVQPANTPTSVVNLSPGAKGSEHIHAKSEEEIERELESKGIKWYRCEICTTPYDTESNRQKCMSQRYEPEIRKFLEGVGWVEDEPVTFIADNKGEGHKHKRIEVVGIMQDWRFVRTKRGHEEMPVVLWHPYPAMFPDGQPPLTEMWKSLLLCVTDEFGDGIMTAVPRFTRKPGDRRGGL